MFNYITKTKKSKTAILFVFLTVALQLSGCKSAMFSGDSDDADLNTGKRDISEQEDNNLSGSNSAGSALSNSAVRINGSILDGLRQYLTKSDIAIAEKAQNEAYKSQIGSKIEWDNEATGNSGTFMPYRDGVGITGKYCREYLNSITVDGKKQKAIGRVCKVNHNLWEITNTLVP